ncbi:MAG: thioredoxin family protein [Flavobacterium sp.]|nr:thioredoxin family protein [Flavobacterium sp.]
MIDIQNEEELQVVLKENELVVVLFYAKWCTPCKKMMTILIELMSNFKKLKIVKLI